MAEKIFTVDKFLGLNESVDGMTELKMGEASKIENFAITDDYNLTKRPGVKVLAKYKSSTGGFDRIVALWDGLLGKFHFTVVVTAHFYDNESYHDQYTFMRFIPQNEAAKSLGIEGNKYVTDLRGDYPVHFFTNGNDLYLMGTYDFVGSTMELLLPRLICFGINENDIFIKREPKPYVPLLFSDCSPNGGGGKELEPINILPYITPTERIYTYHFPLGRYQYCGDGESVKYTLPNKSTGILWVDKVVVDGVELNQDAYTIEYNSSGDYFCTFDVAPPKGVNNVEFVLEFGSDELIAAAKKLTKMRFTEAYNGSTDTRVFFYGDNTNTCFYTGNPAFGDGLYIPAGNEIAVDSSASAITGLRTQNTRLLAFKPDSAFSIDYEPVTLEDGKVIAGFYVYPMHRGLGNDMDNQVQTVNNYARTLCGGSLYEWKNSVTNHKDERYAKRISEKVSRTLAAVDPEKIVTCDDNTTQTYYMFLNDDKGTVLVNRYAIDVWTIYNGEVFKDVQFACASGNGVSFVVKDTVYCFDNTATFDAPTEEGGEIVPIQCVWESGHMSFGADYKRKYSSNLWVSMLPESNSRMEITVQTDRRDEYLEKVTGLPLLDFSNVDFSYFSFLRSLAPKIKRIKIKVKKFVYYKLIFRVTQAGAKATVLGYDQQVRYSSNVK